MVELALILPILVLILCGILDFGWILGNQLLASHSAREGARYAAVNATRTDIVQLVSGKVTATAPAYAQDDLTVSIQFTSLQDVRSGDVIVTATYRVTILTPVASILLGSEVYDAAARCTMKVE